MDKIQRHWKHIESLRLLTYIQNQNTIFSITLSCDHHDEQNVIENLVLLVTLLLLLNYLPG